MSEKHMRRGVGIELTPEEQERVNRRIESGEADRWTALDQVVGKERADRIVGAEQARAIAERAAANTDVEDVAAEARTERFKEAFYGSQGRPTNTEAPKNDS